jgi:hypothetical protein
VGLARFARLCLLVDVCRGALPPETPLLGALPPGPLLGGRCPPDPPDPPRAPVPPDPGDGRSWGLCPACLCRLGDVCRALPPGPGAVVPEGCPRSPKSLGGADRRVPAGLLGGWEALPGLATCRGAS